MGTVFDYFNDGAYRLQQEALSITLQVTRSATSATLSWNIPTSCSNNPVVYNGIIITADTKPFNPPHTRPKDGTTYQADLTIDPDLFSGSLLHTAMVIGAYYFNTTTNTLTIDGLDPLTPYYFSAFPVDSELRYYQQGVHGYSQPWKIRPILGQAGFQRVQLGTSGVHLTDATGLIGNQYYTFNLSLNMVVPGTNITVPGISCLTYEGLIDTLNSQLGTFNNPYTSSTPPNTNSLYIRNNTLLNWNGFGYNNIPFVQSPEMPSLADYQYWLNSTNSVLSTWLNNQWNTIPVINYNTDPTIPPCGAYWFDGTNVYVYNGTTWLKMDTIISGADPSLPLSPDNCTLVWFNPRTFTLYNWSNLTNGWEQVPVINWYLNPSNPTNGYWFNTELSQLYCWDFPFPGWNQIPCLVNTNTPSPSASVYWFNPSINTLQAWNASNQTWTPFAVIAQIEDPTIRHDGDYWFDTTTLVLSQWDSTYQKWIVVSYLNSQINPALPPVIANNTVWVNNGIISIWDSQWVEVTYINYPSDPRLIVTSTVWYNTLTSQYYIREANGWSPLSYVESVYDISSPPVGSYWYNGQVLSQWTGSVWNPVPYSTSNYQPAVNSTWYNSSNSTLMTWNGISWAITPPPAVVSLDNNGNLQFTSSMLAGESYVQLTDINLFKNLKVAPTPYIEQGIYGADAVDPTPMYEREGIGTDGNPNIRNELIDEIRTMLGYPVVTVELTQGQINLAVNIALNVYRQRVGAAYRRGYLFLRLLPNTQKYLMTNKGASYDRIVTVLQMHRMTSAFMSTANGAGVFGQVVIQQLYNMGTYDLLSYYMITQYVETMELLFAGRLTFTWDERSRELIIFQTIQTPEIVTVEVTVERTEQDILTDRWCRNWIRRYTLAQSRYMLAEIRGKYQSLPGAGGSITMDATDLRALADKEMEVCTQELEDFVIENLEEYGSGHVMVMG